MHLQGAVAVGNDVALQMIRMCTNRACGLN
jgi:hypothetical protein